MLIRKRIAGIIFCWLLSGCLFLELGFEGGLSWDRQELYRPIIKNSDSFIFPQSSVMHRISEEFWPEFMPASAERLKALKDIIVVLGSKPLDTQTPTVDLVYRVITGVSLLRFS